MKIRHLKKVFFLLCILCVFAYIIPEANAEDWRLFIRYGDFFYYDKENINYPYEGNKNIIGIWQKQVYDKESSLRIAAHLGKKYADLKESISMVEINCFTKKIQTKAITHYTYKGLVIETQNRTRPDWKAIVPDSPTEALYQRVCPFKK